MQRGSRNLGSSKIIGDWGKSWEELTFHVPTNRYINRWKTINTSGCLKCNDGVILMGQKYIINKLTDYDYD